MKKKWLLKLNIVVLIIVSIIFISMIWNFSSSQKVLKSEECIDVNNVASFVYDSCYDAYSKNIFLTVKRGSDNYQLRSFEFSFLDFNHQSYKITDIPDIGESKAYKFSADKNPQNIYVKLNIIRDFSAPICEEPRSLFVKYCPVDIQGEDVSVNINPLGDSEVINFVSVAEPSKKYSDIFSLDVVEKESIWQSQCESKWKCSGWEHCDNGVQRRACVDLKSCFIPTDVPKRTRYCNETCEEAWECSWSDCSNGFSVPTCTDLNECGTSYSVPKKLNCNAEKKCTPDISCAGWSNCEVNYNFIDLVQDSIGEISGSRYRICKDSNNCLDANIEFQNCSVNIDVYTKRFVKCGVEFIGIYNSLNDELISRVGVEEDNGLSLDIYLDDNENNPYCDYCFDGIKNGDEEGVDCGGICEGCSEKYKDTIFREENLWNSFTNWIKKLLI